MTPVGLKTQKPNIKSGFNSLTHFIDFSFISLIFILSSFYLLDDNTVVLMWLEKSRSGCNDIRNVCRIAVNFRDHKDHNKGFHKKLGFRKNPSKLCGGLSLGYESNEMVHTAARKHINVLGDI